MRFVSRTPADQLASFGNVTHEDPAGLPAIVPQDGPNRTGKQATVCCDRGWTSHRKTSRRILFTGGEVTEAIVGQVDGVANRPFGFSIR